MPAEAYEVLGYVKEDDSRWDSPPEFYVQPINGDPYIGMKETPVTSDEMVVWWLSNLPAYRSAVSPIMRGAEIGLAHGYWIPGPFIKLGPMRNLDFPQPEIVGCIAGVAMVCGAGLWACWYGWQKWKDVDFVLPPGVGTKTLSGRPIEPDPAFCTDEGFRKLTAGMIVGGLAGVAWCYLMCVTLPYYHVPGLY